MPARVRLVALILTVALGAPAVLDGPAAAQQPKEPKAIPGTKQTQAITGIDQIWQQVRVGNKVCMAAHEHYGEGNMPSRFGAERAAIRHFQIHTAREYGNAWGSYVLALDKRMSCENAGGRWTCKTTARPCRPSR